MEVSWRNVMATLNVKNFPDDLYAKLKKRAKQQGRSVSSEVTQLLARDLNRPKKYTVDDLKGLAGPWKNVDVEKWIERERDSW
jgi:plasmid stability protein